MKYFDVVSATDEKLDEYFEPLAPIFGMAVILDQGAKKIYKWKIT